MLSVPRPEIQIVNRSGGSDQSVSELNPVTLGVLAQVIAGYLSEDSINGDAVDGVEECGEDLLFMRASAMPQLRYRYRRAKDSYIAATQFVPLGENRRVTGSRYFNENVGINENGFQDFSVRSRFPVRSRRI